MDAEVWKLRQQTKGRAFLARLDPRDLTYLQLIRDGLKFIRFDELCSSDSRVFIKPNLTFPTYRPGVMTSVEAVEAAIIALQDYTSNIWIGDADSGGYNRFSMDQVYEDTGISAFAEKYGVQVVNLSRLEREPISVETRRETFPLDMPRLLTKEIDLLVTMPVPKIHMNTGVSLTFKNQWGCIPEPNDRLKLHPYFKEVVTAVNEAVNARVAIIDGRFGLNESGPLRGEPIELNWLCLTDGLGAGARVVCDLMGVPLAKIEHLKYAEQRGLIPQMKDIDLNVGSLDEFRGPRFYLRRAWTDYPGLLAFKSSKLANLAYFSRWAALLHKVLYKFREPFY